MQTTGIVLSWLVGVAVAAILIFFVAFIRSNTGTRNQGHGSLVHFIGGAGPLLGFLILAAEAVALVLLIVGVARWPSRIIRSPRWVLSAIGSVFVAAAILVVVYLAAVIAVQNP